MQRSAFLSKGANNSGKTFSQTRVQYMLIIKQLREALFGRFSQLYENLPFTTEKRSFANAADR